MLTDTFTIDVDSSLHADILCIMNDNDCKVTFLKEHLEGSFVNNNRKQQSANMLDKCDGTLQ